MNEQKREFTLGNLLLRPTQIRTSSNPKRGYLGIHFFLDHDKIGWCSLIYNNQTLYWERFYPLVIYQGLERRGIGTLAYCLALQGAVELLDVPSHAEVEHKQVTDDRRKHLETMGLSSGMTVKDYLSTSLDYAIRKRLI
ncbi:hypothetical protein HYX12_02390 [Candidatus Woesearchaeota archaeon]|nr:hypothetical protein [Candidatus Woesearchaeota archaeon]